MTPGCSRVGESSSAGENASVRCLFSGHGVVDGVAVSRDGDYRIVQSLDDGPTQRLHGKMPKEKLLQLTKLLEASEFREAAEFRSLSGNHGA
jgi:hypothetical protein